MKILVINAGSSSLKYQLIDMNSMTVMAKGLCERIGIDGSNLLHKNLVKNISEKITDTMETHADAIRLVLDALTNAEYGVISSMKEIDAVGHRVVHGSEFFADSYVIDGKVMEALKKCIPVAPLHNPPNITGIEACDKIMPGIPQVAVFDTAFHQTMPAKAFMYALPYEYYEKHRIRKFGFHGTSHKFVSLEAAKMLNKPIENLKIITCHLGNGSSVTAIDGGKCVDTSMGFTPLDGVVMGTRTGSMDPAVVTFLMEKENLTPHEVDIVMNKKSGVFGISGISSDFRDISSAAQNGNSRAALALDMFTYSVTKLIGAYAAAMGGVDALVFTAGIGENDSALRLKIVETLSFMGIKIDAELNKKRGEAIDVTAKDATVKTLVIPTDEERMIALDTQRLISVL